MILRKVHIKVSLVLFLLLTCSILMAQPGGGNPGGGGPPVPLSGLEYLIAGGLLAGASRFLKKPKKSSE